MRIFYKMFRERRNEIPPVCNVDLDRYLGKWYEIARFPHSFEKGLENVTATYSLKKNGKINVINSGFKNGARSVAKGVASIPDKNCTGRLSVSFFWPIKGEYRIIKLDEENYTFSVITSKTKNYFWILCRDPQMSDELYETLVAYAASVGFDTEKIIKVIQNRH